MIHHLCYNTSQLHFLIFNLQCFLQKHNRTSGTPLYKQLNVLSGTIQELTFRCRILLPTLWVSILLTVTKLRLQPNWNDPATELTTMSTLPDPLDSSTYFIMDYEAFKPSPSKLAMCTNADELNSDSDEISGISTHASELAIATSTSLNPPAYVHTPHPSLTQPIHPSDCFPLTDPRFSHLLFKPTDLNLFCGSVIAQHWLQYLEGPCKVHKVEFNIHIQLGIQHLQSLNRTKYFDAQRSYLHKAFASIQEELTNEIFHGVFIPRNGDGSWEAPKFITPEILALMLLEYGDRIALHRRADKNWCLLRQWEVTATDRRVKFSHTDVVGSLWRNAVERDMEGVCVEVGQNMRMLNSAERGDLGSTEVMEMERQGVDR